MEASREAELAAGDGGVGIVKVCGADCPPGALAEDLHGASGKSVDVDPAHQPRCPLLPCTRRITAEWTTFIASAPPVLLQATCKGYAMSLHELCVMSFL